MGAPTDRFPLVDALRAVAALAVLGTHAALFSGLAGDGSQLARYAQRLDVGVAVFFLISGFVLYRPFVLARVNGERRPATGPYAWRRALRVVPAYWLALTLTALWLSRDEVFTLDGALSFYGYGQTYRDSTISGGLVQAWTLCIEVAFYAFLPVWALAARRLRGGIAGEALALAALVALSVGWKLWVIASQGSATIVVSPLLLALPAYLDHFALGMGLALLTVWLARRGGAPPAWLRRFDRFPTLGWLVAAVAFWLVSTRIGLGDRLFEPVTPEQYLARHALYAVIALGLLAPAVLGTPGRGVARRLLAVPGLAWLGLVSYGIYLWHLTGLSLLERAGLQGFGPLPPELGWFGAGLVVACGFAALSYYGLERPLGRRARRVPAP